MMLALARSRFDLLIQRAPHQKKGPMGDDGATGYWIMKAMALAHQRFSKPTLQDAAN